MMWVTCIPAVQALGLASVGHFARLMPLLLPWCWAPDAQTRLLALQALTQLLRFCWPRVPAHAGGDPLP